jgi:hypothetical protein
LEKILRTGLQSGSVDLSYFRNEEFEELYNSINSFHDGKNTLRVKEALKKNRFI